MCNSQNTRCLIILPLILIMSLACDDRAMTTIEPSPKVEGVEVRNDQSKDSAAIGQACTEAYDCESRLCFADSDTERAVCVQSCVNEPEVCGEGFICQTYTGYGSICVPNSNVVSEPDMEFIEPDPDMEFIEPDPDMELIELDQDMEDSEQMEQVPDMVLVDCSVQDVYFTNTGGVEIGRVSLSMPNESQEIELISRSNRTNRARVTYNADCTNVSVELLERYTYLCLDFNEDPCASIPDQNCAASIIWYFNNQETRISEDAMCGPTPEERGWTRYHNMIGSCYPNYSGPEVSRFDVGYHNFPLCDDNVRAAHWCVGAADGSSSRCRGCEENLYVCQ